MSTRLQLGCLGHRAEDLLQCAVGLVGTAVDLDTIGGNKQFVVQGIAGRCKLLAKRISATLEQEVAWVEPIWECEHPKVKLSGDKQVEYFVCTALAGCISIKDEGNLVRIAT